VAKAPAPPSDFQDRLQRAHPEHNVAWTHAEAVIELEIDASGVARLISVRRESQPGLGQVCAHIAIDEKWQPALDTDGKPVAVWVPLNCAFTAEY
jgi:hypothetical protein